MFDGPGRTSLQGSTNAGGRGIRGIPVWTPRYTSACNGRHFRIVGCSPGTSMSAGK